MRGLSWFLQAYTVLQFVVHASRIRGFQQNRAICPESGILDSTRLFCCPESCGSCGGSGCHSRPGGQADCCINIIATSCNSNSLPCALFAESAYENLVDSGKCPSGSIASASGEYCCPMSCEGCGGNDCHTLPGGDVNCCTNKISNSCSSGSAPCKLSGSALNLEVNSVEPLALSITDSPVAKYCEDGIKAVYSKEYGCDITVCCPSSCEACDISEDCSLSDECCAAKIAFDIGFDIEKSCRTEDPPCIVPLQHDKCHTSPCLNGGKCYYYYGVFINNTSSIYDDNRGYCYTEQFCECAEGFVGTNCEIKCGKGEEPCGHGFHYIDPWIYTSNKCCAVDEVCVGVLDGFVQMSECVSKEKQQFVFSEKMVG